MLGKYNMSTLNMASGMPNNFADDIFQDSYGFVWICTHGGLVRYDGYTKADGLLCSQFYYNGATSDGKGTIYLGTEKGMMAVTGIEGNAKGQKSGLRFTKLSVGSQTVYAGSRYLDRDIAIARRVRLHESDRSFTFDFSALNFSYETQGVYSYLEENVANRNITEIAYRVGFNDPKYFTRCFTKLYGVAPSAYKARAPRHDNICTLDGSKLAKKRNEKFLVRFSRVMRVQQLTD